MNHAQALDTLNDAQRIVYRTGEDFGGAGGGPTEVRQAVNRLDAKPGTPDATARFARDLLHCHFDTGLNLNGFTNGKAFLDTVFIDFDTIDLPGGW